MGTSRYVDSHFCLKMSRLTPKTPSKLSLIENIQEPNNSNCLQQQAVNPSTQMIPTRQHIRPPVNTTPSRQRLQQHPQLATQFTIIKTPRKDLVSPNKIQNHNRVVIKTQGIQNQRNHIGNQGRVNNGRCKNHFQKPGKYHIEIDGQTFAYCQKCSAHLASQGFHVDKISAFPRKKSQNVELGYSNIDEFKRIERQLGGEFNGQYRMKELKSFVKESERLKSQFNENLLIFKDIPNHYHQQTEMIQEFYDTMVLFINNLREEHLSLLEVENKRYCQLAEVMAVELEETNNELQNILEDIVSNIKEIVLGISEERYRESINYYLQKIQFFKGRVDEQKMSFQEVTSVEEGELKTLIEEFKGVVNNLLGVKDIARENVHHYRQPAVQQIPILKKINNQYRTQPHPQVRDPFRTLFSQQEHPPEQSPHFKVI